MMTPEQHAQTASDLLTEYAPDIAPRPDVVARATAHAITALALQKTARLGAADPDDALLGAMHDAAAAGHRGVAAIRDVRADYMSRGYTILTGMPMLGTFVKAWNLVAEERGLEKIGTRGT